MPGEVRAGVRAAWGAQAGDDPQRNPTLGTSADPIAEAVWRVAHDVLVPAAPGEAHGVTVVIRISRDMRQRLQIVAAKQLPPAELDSAARRIEHLVPPANTVERATFEEHIHQQVLLRAAATVAHAKHLWGDQ